MQKTFIALLAIVGVIAGTLFVVQRTQAFGLSTNMGSERALESQATALGMATDELSQELETKTLREVMNEQGISPDTFETNMQEQAKERMKARGLSDEEIASRIQTMEERMNARKEMFASLMGIDVNTLTTKLETSTIQELLDEYDVSHVELHDAMQQFQEANSGGGFGHHRMGNDL